MTYLRISPRGFSNETFLYQGTPAQVAVALSIVNDDVDAWAERVPASDPEIRRIRRQQQAWGDQGEIEQLTEEVVRPHRPVFIDGDGNRALGGPALNATR